IAAAFVTLQVRGGRSLLDAWSSRQPPGPIPSPLPALWLGSGGAQPPALKARVALRAAPAGPAPGLPSRRPPPPWPRLSPGCRRDGPGDTNRRLQMTNIVILVGNLGADPQKRTTTGGVDVATFSLGTSRVKRDSEGKSYKDESGYTAKDT